LYTFSSAGNIGNESNADLRKAKEDAYNHQKDVMLYALALFGTVTGYYLGRVPAEVNAKRAEQSADTAQKQLAKTQDKLTDTAASASVASAQLGQVKEEKTKIANNLRETKAVLQDVRQTLTPAAPLTAERLVLGTGEGGGEELGPRLQAARERIDRVLARLDAE
jgi:septal ring factor EnvC (AmiA/AmiB activator)